MTRTLRVHDGGAPAAVLVALRTALAGGDAILPAAPVTTTPATAEPGHVPPVTVAKRVAVVIETSGSSGVPKRVALSADALLASAAASESALGGPGQWLLALPTHYIAGINVLVRSITAATEPIVLPGGHFDAHAFGQATELMTAPLRFASVVPAQLLRLVRAARDDSTLLTQLRRLDRILVGGQATAPELIAEALDLSLNITRTYGSSETCGGCVYDGKAIGATEVRIVEGQIEISGPMLAEGYLADPTRTEAAFIMKNSARWYRTGDSGAVVDGILAVTGRLDSVIISGGVKVSLEAIEAVIRGIPGLGDAVVVRGPSREWGEVPVVFTTARASLVEIKRAVVEELGRASAPVAIVTLEELPLLASGKPDRRGLSAFAASRSAR